MSIELIAILVVIVAVIAISNRKKKKPDKNPAQETQNDAVVEKRSIAEKADHEIYTGKFPVLVEKDGERKEGGVGIAETGTKNLRC